MATNEGWIHYSFFHVFRATGILQFRIPNFTSKFPNVTVTSEKKNLTPKNWQQKLKFSNSNTARPFKPIPEQITSASTKTWVWWSKRSQHSWIYLLHSQPDQQRWQWKFHGHSRNQYSQEEVLCLLCYFPEGHWATRSAPTDSRAVLALAYVWLAGVLNRFKIHNPWDRDPRTKTSKSKLRQKIRFCSQVEGFAQTQKTITDHDGVEEGRAHESWISGS